MNSDVERTTIGIIKKNHHIAWLSASLIDLEE